jgi:hypothetical protein
MQLTGKEFPQSMTAKLDIFWVEQLASKMKEV